MPPLRSFIERRCSLPDRVDPARREGPPERAVLVANGSSVDAMPPAFWAAVRRSRVLRVGTNRVLCFAALQGVRWDVLILRDTYRNLWHDPRWGAKYHEELWKPAAAWKVGPADRRVTHCDQFVRQAPGWQFDRTEDRNGEAAVMKNSSVVLMAANWAFLAGVREIFLVGVDYRGRHARMIEPYEGLSPGWEGLYDRPVPESIERQFAAAESALRSGGGRMINLSPGTKLQSVPKKDWRQCGLD